MALLRLNGVPCSSWFAWGRGMMQSDLRTFFNSRWVMPVNQSYQKREKQISLPARKYISPMAPTGSFLFSEQRLFAVHCVLDCETGTASLGPPRLRNATEAGHPPRSRLAASAVYGAPVRPPACPSVRPSTRVRRHHRPGRANEKVNMNIPFSTRDAEDMGKI